ncbi:hypothetical protein [Paenibacillus sp. FSL L8-0499]|uniref:hypothetical protein n=1 Tax=Paenibacillus sp. FSL L8-0499 TaxID=2975334 RepID=UPI0030F762A9
MEHLNRTTCCDHTFTFQDIQGRVLTQQQALGTNQHKLYGGNAKYFAKTQCPSCSKAYLMWLMPKSPNYKVLTISEDNAVEKTTKRIKSGSAQ